MLKFYSETNNEKKHAPVPFFKRRICLTFNLSVHLKRALLFFVLNAFISFAAKADYAIPVGTTVNANTISNQFGTIHIYGVLEINSDVTFISASPITIILYGVAPGGEMLWTANKTLALPAGSTIVFVNNPFGLQGDNAASQILQIGDVKYAAANDNSNNVLFSFAQINAIGGTASVNPAGGSYCFGDPVNLLANKSTPAGVTYRIHWVSANNGVFSSNDHSSATSTILTGLPVGTDSVTCDLEVLSGTNGTYFLAARKKIAIHVKPTYTWLGVNTDWSDNQNWCPSVPSISTDVVIPSGLIYYPVINNTSTVRNLDIASAATVTLGASGTLQIYGSISGTGKLDARYGTFKTMSTLDQVVSGTNFIDSSILNLVIGNTLNKKVSISATGNPIKILASLEFSDATADLETNGKLILVSTASRTARVGILAAGNVISGNVTVERFISAGRKWHFLSVAASGQTFRQAWQEGATSVNINPNPGYGFVLGYPNSGTYVSLGFDLFAPGGPTVKTYNPNTNAWVGIGSTYELIQSQTGYMAFVIGDRSGVANRSTIARTTGSLIQGTQPIVTVAANNYSDKYLAIGNPYASALSLNAISKTNVQDLFVVWDPKMGGNYGLGAYQYLTYDPDFYNYVAVPGGGSYPVFDPVNPVAVNSIESGQAFFVRSFNELVDGQLQITESAKRAGERLVFKTENVVNNSTRITTHLFAVQADSNKLVDAVIVRFGDNYNDKITGEDVFKISNSNENLSILNNGKKLVIDNRKKLLIADTIHLLLTGVRVQNYQFKLQLDKMDNSGQAAFLWDRYQKIFTPLNLNGATAVNFSIENIPGSYAADRFKIIFNPSVVLPVTITSVSASRNNDKTVGVQWKVSNELNLEGYQVERSLDGSNFAAIAAKAPQNNSGAGTQYSITDSDGKPGDLFYRVKAISASGQVQYSAIVQLSSLKNAPFISVYPNLVINKQMNIRLNGVANAVYQMVLVNTGGQVVYKASFDVHSAFGTEMIYLPATILSGNYQLILTESGGKTYSEKVIVQ